MANISSDGGIWLSNIDGTEKKQILEDDFLGYPSDILKWSEDGSLLMVMVNKLYVFDKKGDLFFETDAIYPPILSFDNKYLTKITGKEGDKSIFFMNIFNKERKEFKLPKNVSQVKVVNYELGKEQSDETAN